MAGKSTGGYSAFSKGPISKDPNAINRTMQVSQDINTPAASEAGAASTSAVGGAYNAFAKKASDKNNVDVDGAGNIKLGEPKVYDSVGDAGSGFVNLSHLLGLNRKSGEQSANDLARRTKETGAAAQSGISKQESAFDEAARAGMPWRDNLAFDVGGGADAQKMIDDARNAKYNGPEDLSSMSGYADLSKKVGEAQDMAKASQSAYGVAGQVNKETGLSPTQSAASAFYMGVNNPNIKRAGSAFTNLTTALEQANARAMSTSRWAKGEASRYSQNADKWQAEKDAWDTEAGKFRTPQQKIADDEERARNTDQKVANDNHGGREGEVETKSIDDALWNIKQGMPSELAYMGVSYEQWVAAGRPSYEEWMKRIGGSN